MLLDSVDGAGNRFGKALESRVGEEERVLDTNADVLVLFVGRPDLLDECSILGVVGR